MEKSLLLLYWNGGIVNVALSPDGLSAVSAPITRNISCAHLWNSCAGPLGTFMAIEVGNSSQEGIMYLPYDEVVSLPKWAHRMPSSDYPLGMDYCKVTRRLIVGTNRCKLYWFDTADNGSLTPVAFDDLHPHSSFVFTVVASGTGLVLSGDSNGCMKIWNSETMEQMTILRQLEQSQCLSAIFVTPQSAVVTSHSNGTLQVWNYESGEHLHSFHTQKSVKSMALYGDLLYLSKDPPSLVPITVLNTATWSITDESIASGGANRIARDCSLIYSASTDGEVFLYDCETKKRLPDPIAAISGTPMGLFVIGGENENISSDCPQMKFVD